MLLGRNFKLTASLARTCRIFWPIVRAPALPGQIALRFFVFARDATPAQSAFSGWKTRR